MKTEPLFAIITPTHNRPELLRRAIASIQNQNFTAYEHIIINDSPYFDYQSVETEIQEDEHITYLKNDENIGKNKSLNLALRHLKNKKFSGSVLFLDDDDTLSPAALITLEKNLKSHPSFSWIVSNRTLINGSPITVNNTGQQKVSYIYDCILFKRFKGDATHLIRSPACYELEFPKTVSSGEEWLYFAELEKKVGDFLYLNFDCTLSEGYLEGGVTDGYKMPSCKVLIQELKTRGLSNTTPLLLYLFARKIKSFLRTLTNN